MENDFTPPGLSSMIIQSSDTLRGTEVDLVVPHGWSDTPPVLKGPRGQPETTNLLKGVLRRGVPPALRCSMWLSNVIQTVRPYEDSTHWHSYRTLEKVRSLDYAYEGVLRPMVAGQLDHDDTSSKALLRLELWRDRQTPTYGQGPEAAKIEGVTARGELALKRVLLALQHVVGIVEYAPIVPTLAALLLTAMSESYAFTSIREMSHDTVWYFAINKREHVSHCRAFGHIMHKLHPQTAEYLEDRGVLDLDSLEIIFRDMFVGVLTLPHIQRIIDLFTLEGSKVLFRVGVALFVLYKREAAETLVTISNADEWWQTLRHWANHKMFNFDTVLRKAYGVHGQIMRAQFRFPKRAILHRIIKSEEDRLYDVEGFNGEEEQVDPLGLSDRSEVIESGGRIAEAVKRYLGEPLEVRQHLANWVPLTMRLTNLDLLYSTNYHGRSLDIVYQRLKRAKHTIFLCEVLDQGSGDDSNGSRGTIVGMYASQVWRPSTQVYGDGECFLFRVSPNAQCWKWRPKKEEVLDKDITNEAASAALLHQFMVSTRTYISMGGNRDGSCGLRINEDLTVGESSPAAGFNNEPLHGVNKSSVFSIGLVEIYGLVRQIDGRSI